MQAYGWTRHLKTLLIGAGPLAALAACGGGTVSIGGGGSSSGGSGGSVLQGTFFGYSGNSQLVIPKTPTQVDTIFGVVASDGSGFFADTQASGSQAIFSLGVASSTGSSTLSGFFNAYAASGSTLGDGTTVALDGNIGGTLSSNGGVTSGALSLTFPSSAKNSATVVLDTPALTRTAIATGTYSASAGAAAAASPAISTNSADIYTVSFTSATAFTVTNTAGCSFAGSATPDGTYNIYHLSVTATGGCPGGNTSSLTLDGLASFLPANGRSPLGGTLAKNTLVLELDDMNSSSTPKKYALALVATQQ